jgi:GPH family glycoside/pentoside/hexuronide:cation symporter
VLPRHDSGHSPQRADSLLGAETGWPAKGQPVAEAVPSTENAMKYFIDVQQWARSDGVKLFYFSSFDEPWKLAQEGEVGTTWGLWDKDERLKYAV